MADMRYSDEIPEHLRSACVSIQNAGRVGPVDDLEDYVEPNYGYIAAKKRAEKACEKEKLKLEKALLLREQDEQFRELSDHFEFLLASFVLKYRRQYKIPSSFAYKKLEKELASILKKTQNEYGVGPVFYQKCIYRAKYRAQPGTKKVYSEVELYRKPFIYIRGVYLP